MENNHITTEYTDSWNVAETVSKRHDNLRRNINWMLHCSYQLKFEDVRYFIPSIYLG